MRAEEIAHRERTQGHSIEGTRTLTLTLQDSQNLVPCDEPDLGDPVRVAEDDTDLGGGVTFTSEFSDVLYYVRWRRFQPAWGCSAVWEGRGGWLFHEESPNETKKRMDCERYENGDDERRRMAYQSPCRERACDPS